MSVADGSRSVVVIVGATSAIAQAVARRFAQDGANLSLVARDRDRLAIVAADLRARGANSVETVVADLADPDEQHRAVSIAPGVFDHISHILIAHGVLPDRAGADADPRYARDTLDINFISPAAICMYAALQLERQRSGCLAVIGSVAGDRIRLSNYVYGTAKGALALLIDGLRARLQPVGVRVLLIKPGFVDTPMTAHLRKGALFAPPDRVGDSIYGAMMSRRSGTVYVPGFWRVIMLIIRLIPGPILRRLPI